MKRDIGAVRRDLRQSLAALEEDFNPTKYDFSSPETDRLIRKRMDKEFSKRIQSPIGKYERARISTRKTTGIIIS